MSDTIAWNFRYMHEEECAFQCTYELLGAFIHRLKEYEGLTRAEIEGHKNSNHGWKNINILL